MDLTVEQPCPSCGAEISLHEDDRLVPCPFCDVLNYRVQQKLTRYVLPAKLPSHIDESSLLYVPYLRFKGCVYSIQGPAVRHRLLDTTRLGIEFPDCPSLPVSLGLRPQAMSVRPVTNGMHGRYVRQTIKTARMFEEAARISKVFTESQGEPLYHRAFIGETISRVYLPVYTHGGLLYDGVSHQKLGGDRQAELLEDAVLDRKGDWDPTFLSTVCPECGDVMKGARDTLVVVCEGCDRQWIESDGHFKEVRYDAMPPLENNLRYLPFWIIEPREESGILQTMAHFLQLTNQPVVIQEQHDQIKFTFVLPAFKMHPGQFLQAAKRMTVGQMRWRQAKEGRVAARTVFPVTLAPQEAAEAMKTVLVAAAVSGKRVLDQLNLLKITGYRKKLLYLPFSDNGHDYIEHHSGISLQSAALHHGRAL